MLSVLITSWGWLSCSDKGCLLKKDVCFVTDSLLIKAVGERRGEDAKLIVGVASEGVHH